MFTFTHVAGQYDKTVTRAVLSLYKWDAFISVELCIELGDPRSGSSLTENAATTSFSAVVNVTLPAKIIGVDVLEITESVLGLMCVTAGERSQQTKGVN